MPLVARVELRRCASRPRELTLRTRHLRRFVNDDLSWTEARRLGRDGEAGGKAGATRVTSIADVRDFAQVKTALERGVSELGRLDVVVANAGMTTFGPAWEIPLENWDVTIGVCLTGSFHTAKAAIPIMIEQGTGGAMVFTSSVAGLRGLPLLADYVAAKHGVTGLAKNLGQRTRQIPHPSEFDSPVGGQHGAEPGRVAPVDGGRPGDRFALHPGFARSG